MIKGKTKNKRKIYLTITIIPIISTIILYALYSSTESKMEKLLLLFIFILVIIPFTFQLLFMVLNMLISSTVKNKVGKYKNGTNNRSEQLIRPMTKNSNNIIPKEYKAKENNNENYIELRESVKNYSKNGYLKRAGVLSFKNELDYRLGNNRYNYSSFDFENDMHEIYVKLKSSKLTDDDYLYLKGILEDLAG